MLKQGKFDGSLAFAIDSLKYGANSVSALNAIGKAFIKLGKFDKAFQAFDQAQELSPLNMKRLCVMAEAQFELGQDASALLEEANAIDPNSPEVKETEAKKNIAEGNVEIGKDLLSTLNNIKDIVAYLNNKAVSAAIEKNFDEAIGLYNQAVEAIPDQHAKYRTIVNYNLGILFLRMGEMDQAENTLKLCLPEEDMNIATKAEQLVANIENAKAHNKRLKMQEKDPPPQFQIKDEDLKKIKRGIRLAKKETIINKGERCLYLIYHPKTKLKVVTESLSALPGFKAKKRSGTGKQEAICLEQKKILDGRILCCNWFDLGRVFRFDTRT